LQGRAQASKEELDRADDPVVWERVRRQRLAANEVDYMALARLRWDIHFGDVRAALRPLEREIHDAAAQSRQRRLLRLRVLQGLALQRSGDPPAALDAIAAVVRQAAPEGFMCVIADEGLDVGRLVRRFHAVLQELPARRSDAALMEYLERLLRAFGPIPEEAPADTAHRLMEPLTRKEIKVLQLVAEGCSNLAMADRLGLSESTVRTHLRSINSKLNARSRAEAVAIARRLAVIR
jgi:LuxR family maltose regulon positive regulatory protein